MKPIAKQLIAIAAFSAATLATAQIQVLPEPSSTPPGPKVDEPVASIATGARGPHVEAANAIVQALAADPQLKQSKVTVTPEENTILLTGVTPTLAQMGRISQIAAQHAGQGKVINGINTEEVFIEPNPTGEVQPAQVAEQQPAQPQSTQPAA